MSPLLRNMAWISSILLFLWKDDIWAALGKHFQNRVILTVKVFGDLVSGTNIAVKSAPMMQSAAYNQKVPENFSGDCTWWQSHRLVDVSMAPEDLVLMFTAIIKPLKPEDLVTFQTLLTRSMKVLETIKPAMKAKQIMMEFAIERTWKHDEGEFVIKAGLSKIALKQANCIAVGR